MTDRPLGLGRAPGTRHQSDRILACLTEAEHPLTTRDVSERTKIPYAQAYHHLRRLSGSNTLPYAHRHDTPDVNAPGYPVIWHSWEARVTYVTWSLTEEYRTQATRVIAELDAILHASPGNTG